MTVLLISGSEVRPSTAHHFYYFNIKQLRAPTQRLPVVIFRSSVPVVCQRLRDTPVHDSQTPRTRYDDLSNLGR